MNTLARLRGQMVRMRATASTTANDALDLAEDALHLVDTMRVELSALEKQRAMLQMEIGLHQHETHALLEVMPLAVVITDGQGRIMNANRAASELLGRSVPRLREELLLHFFDDRAAFTELLQRLAAAGGAERTVLKLRPRERAPFDADVTVVPDPRHSEASWLWCLGRSSDRQTTGRTVVVPTTGRSLHRSAAR
jgi:PAS domain-containing protein